MVDTHQFRDSVSEETTQPLGFGESTEPSFRPSGTVSAGTTESVAALEASPHIMSLTQALKVPLAQHRVEQSLSSGVQFQLVGNKGSTSTSCKANGFHLRLHSDLQIAQAAPQAQERPVVAPASLGIGQNLWVPKRHRVEETWMMQHHLFFWIEFRNWRHTVDTFVFNLEITSQTTSGEWEEDSSSRDTHTHTHAVLHWY